MLRDIGLIVLGGVIVFGVMAYNRLDNTNKILQSNQQEIIGYFKKTYETRMVPVQQPQPTPVQSNQPAVVNAKKGK